MSICYADSIVTGRLLLIGLLLIGVLSAGITVYLRAMVRLEVHIPDLAVQPNRVRLVLTGWRHGNFRQPMYLAFWPADLTTSQAMAANQYDLVTAAFVRMPDADRLTIFIDPHAREFLHADPGALERLINQIIVDQLFANRTAWTDFVRIGGV